MDRKITENNFEEIYKTKIEPNIRKLETYRLEQKKQYDKYFKIAMICLVPILVIMFGFPVVFTVFSALGGLILIFTPLLFLIIFISLIVFLVVLLKFHSKCSKIWDEFKETIKPLLLKPLLSCFGNFLIVKREIISLKEINSFGLYLSANTKKDDDIIVGTYKDIPMSIIETKLTHVSGGKHKTTITDFRGLILKIKMNKCFKGITVGKQKRNIDSYMKLLKAVSQKNPEVISPETIKNYENSGFMAMLKAQKLESNDSLVINDIQTNRPKKLEKINLEDPEFNKSYNIYSDSQVESRYLITPSFMERLKNIQFTFCCYSVDFVFSNEYLYLFIDDSLSSEFRNSKVKDYGGIKFYDNQNDDWFHADSGYGFFEVGDIKHTLINKKRYKKVFEELVSIFSLVDYFKLNEKTGL